MNPFQQNYRPSLPSSSSTKRFVQMPRAPTGQLYQDDSFSNNDHNNHHQVNWDDHPVSGGAGGGAAGDKPTGLRHFSTKVCEKVKEKGLTNYNEVADELVADYFQSNIFKHIDVVKQEYDMKNIRRRVYDALNVLLAMNIITKNKKDIRWIGLPASASQEIARLEEEKARREASIKAKKDSLQDMIMQIVSYKNLVERNRRNERENGRPDPETLLHLPFLIINTDKDTNVECSVSSDKSEFLFSFDKKFQIHDDFEVLKKMKLACGLDTGNPTSEELSTAKSFLPSLHQAYVDEIVTSHRQREIEREEKQKAEQLRIEQEAERRHLAQMQFYEQQEQERQERQHQQQQQQQHVPNVNRYNRQLQEHLINDEDRSAAAGIMERDDDMMPPMEQKSHARPIYVGGTAYSPPKVIHRQTAPMQVHQGSTAQRRYYVQKGPGVVGGPMRSEMSPAIRHQAAPRPYTVHQQQGGARMAAGGGTVGAPVKYYSPSAGGPGPSSSQMQSAPRYRVRPPGAQGGPSGTPQTIRYATGSSTPQLAPGQRIVTQRIVAPGGPHPPGTIVRKVIRRVVVGGTGGGVPKPSPAQQVIQKKMMEQDMHHEQQQHKTDQPMTSKQAAAMIQHPPPSDYDDYF